MAQVREVFLPGKYEDQSLTSRTHTEQGQAFTCNPSSGRQRQVVATWDLLVTQSSLPNQQVPGQREALFKKQGGDWRDGSAVKRACRSSKDQSVVLSTRSGQLTTAASNSSSRGADNVLALVGRAPANRCHTFT